IVANRVFMFGVGDVVPAMGVVASGVATSLVRRVMCGALVAYIITHRELRLTGVRHSPDRALLARMLRIGGPVAVQFGLEVGLFSFAAIMMGWIGPVPLAAHQ